MTLDSFSLALKPSHVLVLANGAAHHPVSVSIIIIIKSSLFISYFRDHTVPPVYLSLSSTNYLSGLSEIPLSSVGEGSGLVCHTDLAGCCEGNTGDWYYPNGSVVTEDGALYVSGGQMSVSLMMSGTATAPSGLYCCVVPTSGGMSTACIVLG